MAISYKNVYTDIRARCYTDKDYKKMKKIITKLSNKNNVNEEMIYKKVLFGSDIMINLMNTDYYTSYISTFSNNKNK